MKHILNNISEEEKNAIREQHTGGMKLNTEKFKQLLETKQGDVKPFVSEQIQDRIQTSPSSSTAPKVVKDKMTSSQTNNVVPCAQLGVKSPGVCETKTKKPVKYCSELGVKSPGFCYVDTKQPVPGLKATPATKSQKTGNSVHMN